MGNSTELCSDGTQAHHFVIDNDGIGHCIKPNCNAIKSYPNMQSGRPKKNNGSRPTPTHQSSQYNAHGYNYKSINNGDYYSKLFDMLDNCHLTSLNGCDDCPHVNACWRWWCKISNYSINHTITKFKFTKFHKQFIKLSGNGQKPLAIREVNEKDTPKAVYPA